MVYLKAVVQVSDVSPICTNVEYYPTNVQTRYPGSIESDRGGQSCRCVFVCLKCIIRSHAKLMPFRYSSSIERKYSIGIVARCHQEILL